MTIVEIWPPVFSTLTKHDGRSVSSLPLVSSYAAWTVSSASRQTNPPLYLRILLCTSFMCQVLVSALVCFLETTPCYVDEPLTVDVRFTPTPLTLYCSRRVNIGTVRTYTALKPCKCINSKILASVKSPVSVLHMPFWNTELCMSESVKGQFDERRWGNSVIFKECQGFTVRQLPVMQPRITRSVPVIHIYHHYTCRYWLYRRASPAFEA